MKVNGGKDDRFIQTVTEHVCIATLGNYDPVPEMSERIDAANAIMSVNPIMPKIVMKTVTKTVSKTSVHRESNENHRAISGRAAHLFQNASKGQFLNILNFENLKSWVKI